MRNSILSSQQVMQSVNRLEQKLTEWKDEWKWEPECLKFASIGAPVNVVEDLKNGTYKPFRYATARATTVRNTVIMQLEN